MKKILTDAIVFYLAAMGFITLAYMTGKVVFVLFEGVDTVGQIAGL